MRSWIYSRRRTFFIWTVSMFSWTSLNNICKRRRLHQFSTLKYLSFFYLQNSQLIYFSICNSVNNVQDIICYWTDKVSMSTVGKSLDHKNSTSIKRALPTQKKIPTRIFSPGQFPPGHFSRGHFPPRETQLSKLLSFEIYSCNAWTD